MEDDDGCCCCGRDGIMVKHALTLSLSLSVNKYSFVVHVNITTIVQLVFVVYFTLKYTATTAILVGYGYGYGGIILPKFKFPTFCFGQMTTSCRAKKSSQLSTRVLVVLVPTRRRRI